MKITLLAVGTKMPQWVSQGYHEYAKRLPKNCTLRLQELAAAKRSKTGKKAIWQAEEGTRILSAITEAQYVVALEVNGRAWSTEQLAQNMTQWFQSGKDVTLIVGGADGLSTACRQRADALWSLSPLTLPHPIVRVIIAEQLYRAWSLLSRHPYHRA